MRSHTAAMMFCTLMVVSASGAIGEGEERAITRVRGYGPFKELIASGDARSATFRSLVDEIQQSNTIVMVHFGMCAKGLIRSCLTNVSGDAKMRSIRIIIDTRTTNDRLIATVAHELQHAVEIIRVPDATDSARALALYRTIGMGECAKGRSDRCETEAALAVEARVLSELDRSPSTR